MEGQDNVKDCDVKEDELAFFKFVLFTASF